ncbi:MAG: YbaB/EbfC family nucleoid-associated protein [Chlamydiae bacterium]|nr:YbaB/EbfC family nucleoid-associated protein [Chlamydiota bacterium]
MKKQMRQLEQQLGDLHQRTFTGYSSNQLVTVILQGDGSLQKIQIRPECVDPTDVEGLEDLITQAFKEASKLIENETSPYSP